LSQGLAFFLPRQSKLQAVTLVLAGIAAPIAASGGIELPRNVDAHTMLVFYIDVLASQNVKQGTDFRIIDKIDIR
jgi:hypothetical protein